MIEEQAEDDPVPVESPTPAVETKPTAGWPRQALYWLLGILIAMLILPSLANRMSYSIARGKQEAALEGLSELHQEFKLSGFEEASRLVAQASGRSVVYVTTLREATSTVSADERQFYFGGPRSHEMAGQGSGVVVDDEGYIVTNFHVISGASSIEVMLDNGESRQAELVGADPPTDLALLKINSGGLVPIQWGDSDGLQVGDLVWAIGSPFGLENSITFGIVSAKGRRGVNGSRFQDYLQTDAAVNPGNSGGALVNIRGELVGINTAIIGPRYQGVSFAIPSDLVADVISRLKDHREYARGWLGVQLAELDDATRTRLGIEQQTGALIVQVLPNTPAAISELQSGDLVTKYDGHVIHSPEQFSLLVAATAPNSVVDMEALRAGESITLSVRVGKLPVASIR